MVLYFKNLVVELHILNTYKILCLLDFIFYSIYILIFYVCVYIYIYIYWECILCIILDYKNLKFKYLFDIIDIDFWSSKNFMNIEDMRRKYNPNVDLS